MRRLVPGLGSLLGVAQPTGADTSPASETMVVARPGGDPKLGSCDLAIPDDAPGGFWGGGGAAYAPSP